MANQTCNPSILTQALGITATGPRTVIVPADPIIWDAETSYEYLTLVASTDFGQAYISKRDVPAGTELTNTEYWIPAASFNAQLAAIQKQLAKLSNATLSYGGASDVVSSNLTEGAVVTTSYYATQGDKGGATYVITSADTGNPGTLTLTNGMFAEIVLYPEMCVEAFGAKEGDDISPIIKYLLQNKVNVTLANRRTYNCSHIDMGDSVVTGSIYGNDSTLVGFSIRANVTDQFEWGTPYHVQYLFVKYVRFESGTNPHSLFEGGIHPIIQYCTMHNVAGILTLPYQGYIDDVRIERLNLYFSEYAPTRDMITTFDQSGNYVNGMYAGDNWEFNHVHVSGNDMGTTFNGHYFLTVMNNYNVLFFNCMNVPFSVGVRTSSVLCLNCHIERATITAVDYASVVFDSCMFDYRTILSGTEAFRFRNCTFRALPGLGVAQIDLSQYIREHAVDYCTIGASRDKIENVLLPRTERLAISSGEFSKPAELAVASGGGNFPETGNWEYTVYVSFDAAFGSAAAKFSKTLNVTSGSIVNINFTAPFRYLYKRIYRKAPSGAVSYITLYPGVGYLDDYGDSLMNYLRWTPGSTVEDIPTIKQIGAGGNTVLYDTTKPASIAGFTLVDYKNA